MTEVLGTDLDGQGFGDLLEAAATLLAEIAPRAVDPGFLDALPPAWPMLAEALTQGTIPSSSVDHIASALSTARRLGSHREVDHARVASLLREAEVRLTEQAQGLDPDVMRRVAAHWLAWFEAAIDPDGDVPSDAELQARQGPAQTEPPSRPRTVPRPSRSTSGLDRNLSWMGWSAHWSERSRSPRPTICPRSPVPDRMCPSPSTCRLCSATPAPTARPGRDPCSRLWNHRRCLCDGTVLPVVLNGQARGRDIGREQRPFPLRLRRAVAARDGGCAAPGCSMPAPWCEVHHIQHWDHGGPTSVDNGVLLCSHHHHAVHAGAWSIENRQGVPWFIPAAHLDPARTAQRNVFWRS